MTQAEALGARFLAAWPSRDPGDRKLGREAEFPVVHADGTAADIAVLWPLLSDGRTGRWLREGALIVGWEEADVTFCSEVGRGTIEVIVGPCRDLGALDGRMEAGVARVVAAAAACGLHLLGYGVQPLTEPDSSLMTPKARYGTLLDAIGPAWLSFAVTAADQVHVDVASDEVVAVTNLGNLLAPLVVALCANSPIAGGVDTGVCTWRDVAMGEIGAGFQRHGMPAGPVADVAGWVARTLPMPMLMAREEGRPVAVGVPFEAWLASRGLDPAATWDAWLLHEHYIWNAARPRTAHGTVEIRGACQQPWSEHGAVAALGAGIVCGHGEIASFLDHRLGAGAWPALRAWMAAAVRDGAAAPEPFPDMVDGILDRAAHALGARGRNEAVRLRPLRERWQARRNPAQQARAVFAEGGAGALIAHLAIR